MRDFTGKLAIIIGVWALIAAVFHLYTGYFGTLEPRLQRAVHLFLLIPIVFLAFPAKKSDSSKLPNKFDWVLFSLSLLPSLYLIVYSKQLGMRVEMISSLTPMQVFLGLLMIAIILEACRRAVSSIFSLIVMLLLIYMFIAPLLPPPLHARKFSIERFSELMFLSTDQGIYGFLTGIGSNIIFVFILFAAIMIRSGVGEFFMDISVMIAGRFRGGPAKVAVISSGLYGSVSGSSVADVYSTGSFTIPLMKRIGYRPASAGAIEAVASAGGPLIPPVMGAGAFIMAEVTQTSYLIVVKAAILCSIIYYIGLISSVHYEAVSRNLKPIPKEFRVGWATILKRSPFVIPFILMVYLLVDGISPSKAAVASFVVMIFIWLLMERSKFKISNFMHALEYAVKSGAVIASALAGAGMLVAVVNETGLALSLSSVISTYSFGIPLLAQFLVMIIVLILGAGIPSTPSYVITATIASSALAAFGYPLLSIHLFIFYYAILADITPPVGVTAFAAGNIAGASPLKTSALSPSYAFAGFIVPYIFIANPTLLMEGPWIDIVFTFVVTSIGVIALAAAIKGAIFNKIGWIKRIFLGVVSLLIVSNLSYISIISLIVLVIFYIVEFQKRQRTYSLNFENIG